MTRSYKSNSLHLSVGFLVSSILAITVASSPTFALETIVKTETLESSKYFTRKAITLSNGTMLEQATINGPPKPPAGVEIQRQAVSLPTPDTTKAYALTVPAFNWVFGCSAVSGAMIAGYYDRNGYANMYTGPTDGGVMPLNNSSWPTWSDGNTTYPNCPLIASKAGVDGRAADSKGSVDDYWVQYDSTASDPYITGSWSQHTWSDAIGDYMKTSQSAYANNDGSTMFYNYTDATQLTCSAMASGGYADGTLGRKLFYEARGYTVTDCYNQKTDNVVTGGFSFAQFKAEIDTGHPVLLNLAGHSIVGVGYDESTNPATIYIHDTWDYNNHTMTWGGSYSDMALQSVSIVKLATPFTGSALITVTRNGSGTGTVTSSPAGISCGGTCSYTFGTPQTIVLTATADTGSIFTGWSGGGCSGTGTCTVSLADNTTVTATFTAATPLFSENFDSVTPEALPTGWTSVSLQQTNTYAPVWATGDTNSSYAPENLAAHSPNNYAYFNSYDAFTGSSASLTSPVFSLSSGTTNNTVSFWMYRDDTSYVDEGATNDDKVEVYINTAASLNGATLLGSVFRLTSLSPAVISEGWYNYTFSIPSSLNTSSNYLIFKGISGYGNNIHIDDVSVTGVPVVITQRTLTVNHAYSSAGAVNGGGSISGSGISCSSVNGGTKTGTCTASFNSGSNVTLAAAADANSTFSGWSGGCTGTGGCSFTINANTTVTGTFAGAYKAKISEGNGYDTLTLAHTNAASGATILARQLHNATTLAEEPFTENLTVTKAVTLKGGYNAGFSSNAGLYSTLAGILTVGGSTGSLTLENLIIK